MAVVSNIVTQALRLANRVDPAYRQRALDAVDRNVVYFAERLPWPALERRETFIADGTEFLTFPSRVRSLISIGDVKNEAYVFPGDHFERQFGAWELGTKPSGGPFRWRHLGTVPTIQDPSSPDKLELNTTASDSQTVTIHGLAQDTTASGTALEYFQTTELVVAQETPVASTNLYKEVIGLEASTLDKDNDIRVRWQTGDLPAARIAKNAQRPEYQRIQWLVKPEVGRQFITRYYTNPPKIETESAILDPQIPADFLIWRTVGDLQFMAEQPTAAQQAWNRADQLLAMKIQAAQNHGDRLEQAIPFAPFIDDEVVETWV